MKPYLGGGHASQALSRQTARRNDVARWRGHRADELHLSHPFGPAKEALVPAQDDRRDDERELVDEVLLDEGLYDQT